MTLVRLFRKPTRVGLLLLTVLAGALVACGSDEAPTGGVTSGTAPASGARGAAAEKPVTLRLDAATRKRLDRLSKATDRSRSALAAEAVRQFVELNEWQVRAIEEGVGAADLGQFIDHAKLKAKWEKKLAAAMDKAR